MRVLESYVFTPGPRGAGTVVVPEVLKLEDISHIWNSTRGALVFDVKNSRYGILNVVVAGGSTTLTIETDTSTMSAGDKLQILIYDPFPDKPGTSSTSETSIDAFGRQRVSEPFTLADYKKVYGLNIEFISDSAGAGSGVAFVANEAASRLTVDTGATDYVVHQSRMYHPYQPGKSQLILCSFKLNGAQENAEKRVGYFDDRNGAFLLYDGTGALSFVERRYVTGSPVDFPVTQANWNVDRCDGTGPSGFNIETANTQLMFIDFQWLGVGRVRVGFVHDGSYVVAHEFYHSNVLSTVYWSNPALPVRAEIRNTDTLSASTTLDFICASVQSEGGYSEAGFDFAANSPIRTIGNAPATLPVMALRLTNAFNTFPNRAIARISQLEAYSGTGGFRLDLYRLASHTQLTSTDVGGIVWTQANPGSAVEYSTNLTTYTSATTDQLLDSLFVVAAGGASRPVSAGVIDPATARLSYIAQNIDSTDSQAFLVLGTSLGNGATAAVSMQWRELQ